MTPHQQRARIIIVILGLTILAGNYTPKFWQQPPPPTNTHELKQNIADHPILYFHTLNINKATTQELMEIPGIGPVLAQRITDYRAQHGAFIKLQDLQQVKGIGEKTIEHLRQYCHIEPT